MVFKRVSAACFVLFFGLVSMSVCSIVSGSSRMKPMGVFREVGIDSSWQLALNAPLNVSLFRKISSLIIYAVLSSSGPQSHEYKISSKHSQCLCQTEVWHLCLGLHLQGQV